MDLTDESFQRLKKHKSFMFAETRKFISDLRKASLSEMTEHEFWVTFSFVLGVTAAYATAKMLPILVSEARVTRLRTTGIALFNEYLRMFAESALDARPGSLSMEDILTAAEQ